jgi:hypothetical protein
MKQNKTCFLKSCWLRAAMIAGAAFFLMHANCSPILQWQRQFLGDPIMNFDKDPQDSNLKDHLYPRREGSGGGYGVAGGGCGC